MNITKQKVDDLNATIKVQLDQADYQENVDKVLKNHRKNANVPGFRKGHVPMGMIKKQVGVSVMVEEINKILSESLHKFITEEDLILLGNPLPKLDEQNKIDWANQKDFEFSYEVGIAPEFDVDVVSKLLVNSEKLDDLGYHKSASALLQLVKEAFQESEDKNNKEIPHFSDFFKIFNSPK